jgi:DNA-binding Lrp family transcriptional regulator
VSTESSARSAITDTLDHQIIHAVRLYGRAPFALIADVIGVSEQTVARRYRRMESIGLIRVLGLPTPAALGAEQWILRIQCRPDSAAALADALARRTDINWVGLSAGGSEVVCSSTIRRGRDGQDLLLHRLPRTAQVQSLAAHSILHRFDDGPGWSAYGELLDDSQVVRLRTRSDSGEPGPPMSKDDATLFAALGQDGRASLRRLADATGWSPSRVGRRLDQLECSGALYFDVDLDPEPLGFSSMSYVWITVAPRDLASTGAALNAHDEVAFCAAVTGTANIIVSVVCRDSADLYRYVTTRIGALDSIREIETSPILRRIKLAGTIVTATGLARPLVTQS